MTGLFSCISDKIPHCQATGAAILASQDTDFEGRILRVQTLTPEGLSTVGGGDCISQNEIIMALHLLKYAQGRTRRCFVAGMALSQTAVHAGRDLALCRTDGEALSFGLTSEKLARSE